jgi:flagellar biosynthesis protein FlhA
MFIIVGIVGIIVMMIVPIPVFLVDILLALMISIALMVLMVSMYLDNVLDFSVFPGLLLILSLFRISLNIATTRMILADGEAGSVINSFGDFVTSGNIVVGTIIFIILVIVQFTVITKGSGRIAEVAARFTLDAMPGKQMAVDSDLNAGIISEEEAKTRRKDISREADFYGAMDGASKFVKGDATAGLLITAINIIGGFVTGMAMQDMGFSEAITTYTKLTIGDGLVSQTPSLMISTASGIIVTRAASKSNLGSEIADQFTQSTRAMFISAAVMAILGIVPGMPTVPFLILSAVLGYAAYRIEFGSKKVIPGQEDDADQDSAALEPVQEEKIEDFLRIDQMEMEIGYGLIPLVDKNQGGDLLERITMLRRQMATELGIVVPPIRIRDNIQLQPNEYKIKIKGVEIGEGEMMVGSYLAMNPGNISMEIQGIATVEPAFGLPAIWITESQKENAEMSGYTVVELPAVLATHITELIRKHAHEILTRQDVKALIDNVKEHSPAVVDEVIPSLLGVGEVQLILQNLLREKVSIRNLANLMEIMADAAKLSKDSVYITEQCRQGMSMQICNAYKDENSALQVLTLHPELEQMMEASVQKTERGPRLILRPDMVGKLFDATTPEYEKLLGLNETPVLVTSPGVRFPLKKMLESSFPNLVILSYSEISGGVNIKSVGTITIQEMSS